MGKPGRKKKAKPGGKRRHGGGGGSGRHGARPPSGFGPDLEGSDSDEGGVLRIGGVVVRIDASGTGTAHLSGRPRPQRRRGSSGSRAVSPSRRAATGGFSSGSHGDESSGAGSSGSGGDSEEEEEEEEQAEAELAMTDYLANLAAAEAAGDADGPPDGGAGQEPRPSGSSGSQADGEGEGGSAAKRRRRDALAEREVMRRFSAFDVGDEGPVADLGWPGLSSEEDDSDSSDDSSRLRGASGGESDDDGSGSSSSSSGDSSSSSSGDGDEELLEVEDLEQLSLVQRYPVQARPRVAPLPGQQQSSGRKKQRPGVKGAKGGKLAPGEKKRLKRERREAKRAARAAARGFDLPWVSRQLEEFVLRQGDLQAFGPFGKHECRAVARVAALYGCRCSLQGAKTGRKLVLVAATPRTCLPQGDQLLELGRVLAAQNAAERSGAALDGRLAAAVAGADLASLLPPSLAPGGGGGGGGRWAGVRRGGTAPRGDAGGSDKKAGKKRSKLRPVAFVSVGAINPDDAVEVAAPASTAAAATAGWQASVAGSDEEMAAPGEDEAAAAAFVAPSGGGGGSSSGEMSDAGEAAEVSVGAAAAGLQLLEVVEDLSGSEPEGQEESMWPAGATASETEEGGGGAHAGLGSAGATYSRLTALSLSPRGRGSARGSAAAQGITNPGRLLGLGLALGIGAEVFGAPGPADVPVAGSPAAAAVGAEPDLSPLSPLLSKSQARKLQRAAARAQQGLGAAGTNAEQAQPGRKGKAGRSKAERRARGRDAAAATAATPEGAANEGEGPRRRGGLGLSGDHHAGPSSSADGGDGERPLVAGDYGFFERHTTGIGSRLLAKWGFAGEGAGLGRQQQGRAEPLQAVQRAKKLGLGAER